jgi:hypothetical protein
VPRKPRAEVEAGLFHVYARGNDKRLIYRDDHDRGTYLRILRGTVRHFRWRLLAYCLMDNHVHLLLEAGLCRHPDDWPWSSHSMIVSDTAPDWIDVAHLLDYFAAAGGEGRRRYAELFLKGQSL